ncbi:MAG: CPBP family glutamic-type intramembrane protease, partial [Thermoanaerobaculia bacterium]
MEAAPRVPLTRRDWVFIAVCIALMAVSAAVIANWFSSAFPEASIDFRYDRATSKAIAGTLAAAQRFDRRGMKHTVVFDSDNAARIFLERSLGLKRANEVMKREVRLYYWHHRWFRPLQEEEMSVDVAPTGEIVSMTRRIPESRAMRTADPLTARRIAEEFLTRAGAKDLELLSQSERKLPHRVQQIFTWKSRTVHPAGAEYRHTITVDGDSVSSYGQRLKVPEEWLRTYRELRSKNGAAGSVDLIFMVATTLAALVIFIVQLLRGNLRVNFLLGVGMVTFVLSAGSTLNGLPSAIADGYNTTTSYPAFLAQFLLFDVLLQSIGAAMLLIVMCGAGEVLYRQRLPKQLALPKIWTPRALTSKRVFKSLILGYTLVAFFIAYQTIFYVIAEKWGAWAPAEIPYDDILSTAIPWFTVLFAGFFPAMSEEFLSRAFSIPFFERIFRSRALAIVLAGYVWGFGHSTYPNQPFYIRGLEVGSAGVILGFLMQSFGLLPLLIWHYTVDAVYTALMLFRSGNAYYIVSGAVSSLLFAIPLIASVVLYIRNRGFTLDDDLNNETLPVSEPPPHVEQPLETPLPEPVRTNRVLVITCVVALGAAILFVVYQPPSPDQVVDYRITGDRAKALATAHLRAANQPLPAKVAALPVSGFRSWDPDSGREEGGSPDGFDDVAATYMVRHGLPIRALVAMMRTEVPAASWMVRFFTPMQKAEYFVEIDPRTSRVVGYHKYADEKAPGARLERDAALAIATSAFGTYGRSPAGFEMKEALTFPQPNRRDWLFHFQERKPIATEAVRRVSVRVMGAEVTQFAITVRVPEAVYREAHQRRFLNILLFALRVLGAVTALALVVSGFIISVRHGRIEWRRAARITLLLAIIPIARAVATKEIRLFTYGTDTLWSTFVLNTLTGAFLRVGFQLVMLFIAVTAILIVHPYAPALLRRAGRSRFGRHAAVATLTAIGLLMAGRELLRLFANLFPHMASVGEISIPDEIAIPMPALIDFGESIFGAVVFAGAAALFRSTIATWKNRLAAPMVTMAVVFCVTIDSTATLHELPMTIVTSAALAGLVWVIARYVLDGNPLAWPIAA